MTRDYSQLSDFEINKAVAIKQGNVIYDLTMPSGNKIAVMHKTYESGACKIPLKDYCNSWEDMGPIIEMEKITITFRSRGDKDLPPQAKRFGSDDYNIADKNPLRAAAIVYLMMEETL